MLLTNNTNTILRYDGLGLCVAPGDSVEVEDGYCRPLRAPNGSRIPSIIERVCPGLEPADAEARKAWKVEAAEEWIPEKAPPSAAEIESRGVAPAVAGILAAKKAAEVAEAKKAAEVATASEGSPAAEDAAETAAPATEPAPEAPGVSEAPSEPKAPAKAPAKASKGRKGR